MKKIIAVVLMIICTFGLIGCGNNDEVLGRWECVAADLFGSGMPLSEYRYYDLTHQSLRDTTNITFYKDKSCSITVYGSVVEGTEEYPYKWHKENEQYLIDIDYPDNYEGERQTITFTASIDAESGEMKFVANIAETDNRPAQSTEFTMEHIVEENK